MKKIRVLFDKVANSLDVWFEEPKEAICEETGDEVILKKDPKTGKVIGFEKLNFSPPQLLAKEELQIELIKA